MGTRVLRLNGDAFREAFEAQPSIASGLLALWRSVCGEGRSNRCYPNFTALRVPTSVAFFLANSPTEVGMKTARFKVGRYQTITD
jgi:hypothetical protein